MQHVYILSTKTIVPALMEQASAAGIQVKNIDFIRTEPIISKEKADQLASFSSAALVFTSTNAVEAVFELLQQYPNPLPSAHVYCMAGRTAEKLAALFPQLTVKDTGNKASELADKIIEDGEKDVIFFSGNLRRDDLPEKLKANGIHVHELEIYKTFHTPRTLGEEYDGIIFFSPSAAESFFSTNRINNNTVCFAIGETTAAALRQHTNNRIMVAEHPRQENVIAMVIDHFNN
ncbi:MAG TPA: uroporphyrinogen-III synthase [Chitinophagaceae bacterium]|nr:uroporphyrinogen-III synthase [Chitinophagaceae bacterium]